MKQVFTLLFFILSFPVLAQQHSFEFQQQNTIKLVVGTDTLRGPWVGGLNSPVFSTIKLNNDGVEDLYVFDRHTRRSFTFLADNATNSWQWKFAPEYAGFFPASLAYWVLLRDFNGDGKKDLFTTNGMDILMFENLTQPNGPVTFSATPRILKFRIGQSVFLRRIEISPENLPALNDIDGDGDLDILAFDAAGKQVTYYRNQRVESGYNPDSLNFTRITERWGNFTRCSPACNSFEFGTVTCRAAGVMHLGGGSLLALDLDGDNDRDILAGADMCPDLVRLTNSGSVTTAAVNGAGVSASYPVNTPASIVNYPAAYHEDVTFDGKKDLLVSPFLANDLDNANFARSAWLYQNNAASATAPPVFDFSKNNFLQDQMFDVGLRAMPAFADIDADGDLDLLVSNFADYRNGPNLYRSSVSLYTNVGTVSNPIFKLTNSDYLQFSQADYKGISLQFGDLNGDGSKDLILKYTEASSGTIGTGNTYAAYIPNQALPNQPYNFSRTNQVFLGLDVDALDKPFFYDMDGDNDLDLLLGTDKQAGANSGPIHYWRRVGTDPTSYASWQLVTNNLGNIPRITGQLGVHPVIADLNHDNQPDLITTDESGQVRIYPDALVNLSATFTGYNTVLQNNLLGLKTPTALGKKMHLATADLDNDQRPDLVIGTQEGGLVHLKNSSQLLGIGKAVDALKLAVFPNPATEMLHVTSPEKIKVSVYDLAGKLLQESKNGFQRNHGLNTSGLKPGVYFLKIATQDFRSAGRSFIIQH